MSIRHFKIFIQVCHLNSITLAAIELNLSQPAVSLAIKELERFYQVQLFDRIGKKLYITEDGKYLLNKAKQMNDLLEETNQHLLLNDFIQQLRIGSSITIGTCFLPEIIYQSINNNPSLQLHIDIDNSYLIENKLLDNNIDIGFIEGHVQHEDLIQQMILNDQIVIFTSSIHQLTSKKSITLNELLKEKLIVREVGSGTRNFFDSKIKAADLSYQPFLESSSSKAIIEFVKKGIGVGILPYQLVEEFIQKNELVILSVNHIDLTRQYHVIYHKNKYFNQKQQQFLNQAINYFKEKQKAT